MNSLAIAIQQFAKWRTTKGKGKEQIPDKLWALAVTAALELDPISVARALGLSTYKLRQQMQEMHLSSEVASTPDVMVFPCEPSAFAATHAFMAEILIHNRIHIRIPSGASKQDLTALLSAVSGVL